MVALQDDVSLSAAEENNINGRAKKQKKQKRTLSASGVHTMCIWSHLLFVVVTGHVQNKQAVAQRADRDACKRRMVTVEPRCCHPVDSAGDDLRVTLRPFSVL